MKVKFKSNGKLLLSGEYLVLKGAKSLSIPTKFSQTLEVSNNSPGKLKWESYDQKRKIWFDINFDLNKEWNLKSFKENKLLFKTLSAIKRKNPELFSKGVSFKTTMDFNRNWGLGSSSSLINNLATWANLDKFKLYWNVTNGSGYDLASSSTNKPIVYKLSDKRNPYYREVNFNPHFKNNLYFIYLGNKQNTYDEILNFNELKVKEKSILKVSSITEKILNCDSFEDFKSLIKEHEGILSKLLKRETIKDLYFKDYLGEIKSLGAWGGDFILAAGDQNSKTYFNNLGYNVVFTFGELIKS